MRSPTYIAALAILAGCAPGEPAAVHGSIDVSLRVASGGIGVVAEGPAGIAQLPAGRGLAWSYRAGGKVVAAGTAADPRLLHAEFAASGAADASAFLAPVGVVDLRLPNVAGELRVEDAAGRELGRVEVPPWIDEEDLVELSRDVLGPPRRVVDHGEAAVNLLVLPEGYREEEMAAFHADVDRAVAVLAAAPGYREHWSSINVWSQDIRSQDSGVADPAAGTDPTTAFELTFGDDKSFPRRLLLTQPAVRDDVLAAVKKLARAVHADGVIVLANVSEYAGSGGSFAALSKNDLSGRILAHELGHTLFQLHDEYSGNGVACQPQLIGAASNLAVKLDALPWRELVNVPALPTDPDAAGDDAVGAFEGGGYCDHGVYRAQKHCLMREVERDFCGACLREVDRYFAAKQR